MLENISPLFSFIIHLHGHTMAIYRFQGTRTTCTRTNKWPYLNKTCWFHSLHCRETYCIMLEYSARNLVIQIHSLLSQLNSSLAYHDTNAQFSKSHIKLCLKTIHIETHVFFESVSKSPFQLLYRSALTYYIYGCFLPYLFL